MALGKIISVKNIGRFLNAAASGDVTFRHNTLVFAPNGRGKTTLCAILRSLKHGEPAYITGRRSLGSPDQPEVRFLLDNNRVNFNNGAWSETLPELAIFDATYVTENVHSGEAVDTEQRRNLYRDYSLRDSSIAHGEPAYITGRRSLGSPDQPEVRFLLDNNRVNFNNGAWSETLWQ